MATEKRLIDADVVRHNINVHMAGVIYRGVGFIPSGKDSNSAYEFLRGYEEGAKYIANEILQEKYLVDAVEVVHGIWFVDDYDSGDPGYYSAYIEVHCSKCGYELGAESGQYGWAYGDPFPLNYCPNCGAKMCVEKE